MRQIAVIAGIALLLGGCTTTPDGVGQTPPASRSAASTIPANGSVRPTDIASIIARWPTSIDILRLNPPDVDQHYRDVFSVFLPRATQVEFRHLNDHGGGVVFDVMFVSGLGSYDNRDIQRLRTRVVTGLGAADLKPDTYRGRGGVFGTPAHFAFAAHRVAVFVLFSDFTAAEAARIVTALRS